MIGLVVEYFLLVANLRLHGAVLLTIACFGAWKKIARLGLFGSEQEFVFRLSWRVKDPGLWIFCV